MVLNFKVVNFVKTTAVAPVDQVVTGVGFTPKFILFFGASVTGESNNFDDDHRFFVGFSDGTAHRSAGFKSLGNQTTTSVGRYAGTGCIITPNSTGTLNTKAIIKSFNADGFTLTWQTNDTSASVFTAVCFGGSDITNAKVGEFTNNTVTGNQAITGVGFKPDVVFFLSGFRSTNDTGGTNAGFTFGIVDNKNNRTVFSLQDANGQTTPIHYTLVRRNVNVIEKIEPGTGVAAGSANATSLDSDGFTLNWSVADVGTDKFYYAAIKGGQWLVNDFTAPTVVGMQSVTGSTFKPVGGIFFGNGKSSSGTQRSGNKLSMGAASAKTNQYNQLTNEGSTIIPTQGVRYYRNSKLFTKIDPSSNPEDSIKLYVCELQTFDKNGFTVNWTTNDNSDTVDTEFLLVGNSPVTKDSTHVYSILNTATVGRQYSFLYGMGGHVIRDGSFKYHINSITGQNFTFIYNITYPVDAPIDLTCKYRIRKDHITVMESVEDYYAPLHCSIDIKDKTGSEIYYNYNSFVPSYSPLHPTYLDFTVGLGQSGTFQLLLADHFETLDPNKVGNGVKVEIQCGKFELEPYFSGFVRKRGIKRDDTNTLVYVLTGFGSQVRYTERVTNFIRSSARLNLSSSTADIDDPAFLAPNLFKTLLTDPNNLPIGEPLETIFTTNGIDDSIREFIASINEPLVEFAHAANTIADTVGAIWGVDANDDVFFRFPTMIHSGVTIKDKLEIEDTARDTSYFHEAWSYEDSIEKADGFANRVYGKASTIQNLDTSNFTSENYHILWNQDLAQKFKPGSAKFKDVALLLSKAGVGTGANPDTKKIVGHIVLDKANTPTGDIVAIFKIPVNDVKTEVTPIFNLNLNILTNEIQANQDHWIVLYEIGDSDQNTIRWHHDDDFVTAGRVSAVRTVPEDADTRDINDPTGWLVSNTGPVFAHATFTRSRQLTEASDPASIEKYGLIETVVEADWIVEQEVMSRYLYAFLQWSAKPKRIYDVNNISPPDKQIGVGALVTIYDTKAKIYNVDAEVLELRYEFNAETNALGCRSIQIRPVGYVDDSDVMVAEPFITIEPPPPPPPPVSPTGVQRTMIFRYNIERTITCTDNLPVNKSTIKASSFTTGNEPQKSYHTKGRWDAKSRGSWIEYDLSETKYVCNVRIKWYYGDTTRKYKFTISAATTAGVFTDVFSGQSAGLAPDQEIYSFVIPIQARYIRITVDGNTDNDHASIWELDIFGDLIPPLPTEPIEPPIPAGSTGRSILMKYNILGTIVVTPTEDMIVGIFGDISTGSTAKSNVKNMGDLGCDVIIADGDLSYTSSASDFWNMMGSLDSKTKITIGNHDDAEDESSAIRTAYLNHYGYPSGGYFAFTQQYVHFLFLNTQDSFSNGSNQYTFAQNDLAAAKNNPNVKWIIVAFHKPIYGINSKHGLNENTNFRKLLHPMMQDAGVDFCYSAHNHEYDRTYPLKYNPSDTDGSKPTIATTEKKNYVEPDGIIFFRSGLGGKSQYPTGTRDYVISAWNSPYGVHILEFSNGGKNCHGYFYSVSKAKSDEFFISKNF